MVITDLDQNLFVFKFFSHSDKDFVMEEGPWAFDGHVLLLREIDANEQPSKIKFSTVCFWLKIHDLPTNMRSRKFAEHLANKIGSFVDVDPADLLIPSKALKIRVDCDLNKPLRRGLMVKLSNTPTWLPDFCYACGLLGHAYRRCMLFGPTIPETDLQHGPWIRALLVKKKAKENIQEILQERERLLGLREVDSTSRAKMKLSYEISANAAMNVDTIPLIIPTDMTKRKKDKADSLGSGPSFMWRSLHHAEWVVEQGSRWLVGDDWSLNIHSKWIPRPMSFKVLTPMKADATLLWVSNLIDYQQGEWNDALVKSLFLPIDAEAILNIPLCST
ncbi:hypothetical protein Cgig2_009451 [Carnegiea gigantea]|uniref:CCHC-type domain-containing protein n=1 Tax=Carnegiea gigantea TaxID=171969 RepID=A0A9Q1K7F2_9CARY|nr:hypothetical protein Cgig2_009451 [Carnegiea gigantea]